MPWLEPIRMIADWLNGDLLDYQGNPQGVNAKLVLTPRDAGDPLPADVTVVDSTRSNAAALEKTKAGYMQVSIYRDSSHGDIKTIYRDGEIPVAIGLALNDPETAEAQRDESYIMRALMYSLAEFERNENDVVRRRNRVNLHAIRDIAITPAEGKIGDRDVLTALRCTVKVRDTKPHGTEP